MQEILCKIGYFGLLRMSRTVFYPDSFKYHTDTFRQKTCTKTKQLGPVQREARRGRPPDPPLHMIASILSF